MSDNHKKPGVAFWATAVVVAAGLYVLSSGPAVWINDKAHDETLTACLESVYSPISWLWQNGPEPISDLIDWWGDLWTP